MCESYGLTYLSSKFTIVDVQVGATHSTGLYFNLHKLLDPNMSNILLVSYQDIVLTKFRKDLLNDAELSSFSVL